MNVVVEVRLLPPRHWTTVVAACAAGALFSNRAVDREQPHRRHVQEEQTASLTVHLTAGETTP